MSLCVHPFYDPDCHAFSYVVANPETRHAAVIDPVDSAPIIELVRCHRYIVSWILETHVHADHVSAAPCLRKRFITARVATGAGVREVQRHFTNCGRLAHDKLFTHDERFDLGCARGRVLATPGHTPGCVTYVFEDFAFVGDTLFMPDYGTARCDFPGGDARTLYGSIRKIFALPSQMRLLMCHDYPPAGRGPQFCSSVADQRTQNVHVGGAVTEDDYVALRERRDATLTPPANMLASVHANLALRDVA